MKVSIKKTAAVLTAFTCSAAFCCLVFCSGFIPGEEQSDNARGSGSEIRASGENAEEPIVIVIDAGHGGMDGGASAADGTMEKEINLQIAMKLKEIAEEYPVDVVMTRESDISLHSDSSVSIKNQKRQDLLKRKEIIDRAQGELAVSIHLNSFKEDESVYGAQVFYPRDSIKRTEGRTYEHDSKEYAENIQKAIEMNISDGRERQIMTKDDFLVFEAPACPMVLVECGFLSNSKEREKLKTPEYQAEMAEAIWQGINEILCLEKDRKMEIVDSANKGQKK